MLFLIYENDFVFSISSNIIFYADNTTAIVTGELKLLNFDLFTDNDLKRSSTKHIFKLLDL